METEPDCTLPSWELDKRTIHPSTNTAQKTEIAINLQHFEMWHYGPHDKNRGSKGAQRKEHLNANNAKTNAGGLAQVFQHCVRHWTEGFHVALCKTLCGCSFMSFSTTKPYNYAKITWWLNEDVRRPGECPILSNNIISILKILDFT